MEHIRLSDCISEKDADEFAGIQPTRKNYDRLFRESVRIDKPDGSPLAVFLKRAIPPNICKTGYDVFRLLDAGVTNRGMAAAGKGAQPPMRRDGKRSNTRFLNVDTQRKLGLGDSSSAVVGFMDRYIRHPFCRKTAFNMDHPELFSAAMPYVIAANALFARELPERFAAQKEFCDRTEPDWVIPGTVFTTITVNKNFPTRVHKDAGDLKEGFGCMGVLRAGHYTGGYFVYPRYRVAFDCGSGDVLLGDVHEWHGNTRILGIPGAYERVSCVFYYRAKMHQCGTMAEELASAKGRQPGDPLYAE